jgi:alkylmercury lyase
MNQTQQLERNVAAIRAQFDEPNLVTVAWKLLSDGQPVSVDRLAAGGGWTAEQVRGWLGQHKSAEWDEQGRLLGLGLTLRPTPHKFTFDGRTVYGWCASDTLLFPVLLGKQGTIESKCPVTGASIRVDVAPAEVLGVDPPSAVVSEVRPTHRVEDLRANICSLGSFFSSREAAAEWLARYPQGQLNSVADDFDLHRRTAIAFKWIDDAN